MSLPVQRLLKILIGFCLAIHPLMLVGGETWGPEEVLRLPEVDESLDLGGLVRSLGEIPDTQRSEWVFEALQAGYMPDFLRRLQEVHSVHGNHKLSFWVMRDYLSIGDDDDFLHAPLNGRDALNLADSWNMYLPTRKMVDLIYSQAAMLLPAEPLSIDTIKDPMRLWLAHEEKIDRELQQLALHADWLQAGHMKDLVLTPLLIGREDRAAIYGWQGTDGMKLQGLATSVSANYEDYSMGARLVAPYCLVDGQWMAFADVLRNPELAPLLSDEGAFDVDRILKLDPLPPAPDRPIPGSLLVHHRP